MSDESFIISQKHPFGKQPPNGLRYPLVGGTRQRHFAGTNFKPRKVLENAQMPTITTPVFARGSGARCVGTLLI
jgi:hypothetical protein